MKFQVLNSHTLRRIFILFLIAILAIAFFIWISFRIKQATAHTEQRAVHTYEIIINIEKINHAGQDIQSAAREYAISGNAQLPGSAAQSMETIKSSLSVLEGLVAGREVQQQNLDSLSSYVKQLDLFFSSSSLLQPKKINNLQKEISLIHQIRDQTNTMLRQENELISGRILAFKKAQLTSFIISLFGGVVAMIFLTIGLLRIFSDVRKRNIAEENARQSEIKYRRLIEGAGVVMFTTNQQGQFNFVSSRALELTGYTAEELTGQPFSFLVAPDWVETVSNYYAYQFKNNLAETLLEFPIITKEKKIKWVEQIAVTQQNPDNKGASFQCIVRDITEPKNIELELQKSEQKRRENEYRLQSILDNAASLIYIKDLEGNYVLANNSFKKIFHVTDETLYGKTDYDFNSKEAATHYQQQDAEVISTGKTMEFEEDIEMPDGRRTLLVIKFPLLDNHKEIFGLCGMATDITDRSRNEQQLIIARQKAEEAEKLQELFLANMSHEIRTPINGIIGMSNLLSSTTLNKEQQEFLQAIRESSDNLLALINDILDLSKIKADMLTIEKMEFNLREVINKINYTFAYRMNEKALIYSTHVGEDIPEILLGDPYRLSQILINLVGNAVKFTESGGIRLEVNLKNKTANIVMLEFIVQDSGIGIAEEKLSTIFDSFSQGGNHISRLYGGTGLGLAITKKLVEIQDGQIEVHSQVKQGSTFRFLIPYSYSNKINKTDAPRFTLNDYANELKGLRILVAEDNLINQKVIYYTLQKAGMETDIAANGKEAISRLQSFKKYQLILMDLQMPEMDGYQAAYFIREEMKMDIPIIAMTATAMKGEKEKCIAAGMNEYISKPFAPSDLFACIKNLSGAAIIMSDISHEQQDITTPGYNLSYLQEIGDNDYLKEVLQLFLNSTPKALQDMQTANAEKNFTEVHRIAHKLKTSLGLFQMNNLLEKITDIEMNAKQNTRLAEVTQWITECGELYKQVEPLLIAEKENIPANAPA